MNQSLNARIDYYEVALYCIYNVLCVVIMIIE